MRQVLALVRLDASAQRGTAPSFLLVVLVASGFGLFGSHGHTEIIIPIVMMLTSFLPAYLFAADERGHFDALFSILPLTRRHVVRGRFATLVLLMGVLTAVAALATAAASAVSAAPLTAPLLATVTAGSFAVACLLISLQMPIYFTLGAARAGLYPRLFIFLAVMGGGALIGAIDHVPSWATTVVASPWFAMGTTLAGVALLAISMAVSTRAYCRRAL